MIGETLIGVDGITGIADILGLCLALGAEAAGPLTPAERDVLAGGSHRISAALARRVRAQIRGGLDPLGDTYCRLVAPRQRRPLGQTYTPAPIVEAMVAWASDQGTPARIVDPGAGSGRYLMAAARRFPQARLIGTDVDPVATLMLRANIAAAKLTARATATLGDYRTLDLPAVDGPTLFLGNPPYVRHHQIAPEWKRWLLATARRHGLAASGLAGLHVHFLLATAEHARPGDYGCFITSAEWLDVNYGRLARHLLLDGLGGESLHVLDPKAAPFADATTTGAITCFKVGSQPSSLRVRRVGRVQDLGRLEAGRRVSRRRLAEANRWSVLTRVTPKLPDGFVELGEICRVHRGAVTGANEVWVHARGAIDLPAQVLFPAVTKAQDLFRAGDRLTAPDALRCVIDLPVDLDQFDADERRQVDRFLAAARHRGVHEGYIATARRAWWSVGLRAAAPVLATYMARRPPAFVRNDVQARHINVAHGLYPREDLSAAVLDALATYLRTAVNLSQGRTYAGGLVKFEPKEMERIPVDLAALDEGAPP